MKGNKELRSIINSDIITLFSEAETIGWELLRETTIFRVLYLAGVLFSFRYPKIKNPFSEIYHFTIDQSGPYSNDIKNSLVYLETNDVIVAAENAFHLNKSQNVDLTAVDGYLDRKTWLQALLYILGLYGEGKIYEFVIRDPEYQDHLDRNAIKELSLNEDNKTIIILNKFKKSFESTLGIFTQQIDDKEYLQLYFEYVFSKVLKGEVRL